MKKLITLFSIGMLSTVISCTDDITSLNSNPKSYTTVPGAPLFTNAERNLVDAMTSANVNRGIFRLTSQQWVETTYTDETRYDLKTRGISQNFWTSLYRDVLKDLNESTRLITADKTITNAAQKANQLAIIDIVAVYAWSTLVATFGDVPYAEALNPDNLTPAYGDAKTITLDLLTRLNADLAALSPADPGFAASAELIYAGSPAKWVKFANSLKIRIGIMLSDEDPAAAKTAIDAGVAGGPILTNADNAIFNYQTSTPNTNPVWVDLVQSGRQDFVAANTVIGILNDLTDPRAVMFFKPGPGGVYVGGTPGVGNSFASFSQPSAKITATNFPGDLLDAAETNFYLAEAASKGVIAGTAATYYTAGVTASLGFWGVDAGGTATYLANPKVAFATAAGTDLEKIARQAYLGFYNRGFEAWTSIRRLDSPVLADVIQAQSGFPVRFTYPIPEQNINTGSYNAAVGKIEGGDVVEAQLFWDKQ